MLGSELIRYVILPFIVFVALMVGVSALLQDSLVIYKLAGDYVHWAIILLVLPILTGLVLRYLETEMSLLVILLGSVTSTASMYFLYKTYFWAQAPTIWNAVFLCAVIAGGAHLPYSRGPIEKFFGALLAIVKPQKKKKSKTKNKAVTSANQKQPGSVPVAARGGLIPLIEMCVGIVSIGLSVYSIAFMGNG